MEKISVIIAIYNGQKYIHETVESILAQTYKNYEIIAVVNCSDDNTIKILNSFNDSRIKIYETNICQLNFNLNYALLQSSGKYIARIDADDIAVNDRFFKQIECISKYHYDVVGTNLEYIDEDSNSIGYKSYPEIDKNIRKKIYYKSIIAHPSVMCKKDLLLKHSGYMGGKVSEDYDLWLRLMRDKSIQFYNIQENLTKYRIHSSQARGNKYAYAEIAGYFLREALHRKSFKSFIGCFVYIVKALFR
ncbi:MAG: glycosyltransferase [Sulfurimonas sp.]|nr:glycosyltransferase [Sulfurimonas sp.]